MFGKKSLDLGIIIGENSHQFLSFDEYAEHFLLPFSPRFCNIDFAISTLVSGGIKNIIVFVKRDKDIMMNYLTRGWPSLRFTIFDYIDIKEKFIAFLNEFMKENSLELIAITKGNYPVWLDLKGLKSELEKSNNIGIYSKVGRETIFSGLVVERHLFMKRYESYLFEEASLDYDIIEKIAKDFKVPGIEAQGYIMPIRNLKNYYDTHIQMLDDYLSFDRYNAYVPVRGTLALNIFSNFGKGSHVINSIVGENVEIAGKVENSVIFSNVKIGRNAVIKNSLILPGNHVGSNAQIVNSIIDEFSEDNTLPNIEPYANIGSENAVNINQDYPEILNFGVTLIGKDIRIPASSKVGGNCYIDSFVPTSIIRDVKKLPDGSSILRKN